MRWKIFEPNMLAWFGMMRFSLLPNNLMIYLLLVSNQFIAICEISLDVGCSCFRVNLDLINPGQSLAAALCFRKNRKGCCVSGKTIPKIGACRLAIVGAGLVGKRHAAAIDEHRDTELVAIVDLSKSGQDFAAGHNVPFYDNIELLLNAQQIDGVILSTPTPLHLEHGLSCIAHGLPTLIEKPLAATAQQARQLVDASRDASVPVLVGHHRRYNPIIDEAHRAINEGRIGEIRVIPAQCWFYKPDDYFDDAPWRKRVGAGPISVNPRA